MIIYKTTNLINGKFYIGKDKYNNPNYFGSGLILKRSIKKYGIINFKKEILEYCNDEKELNIKEIYWIEKLKSITPNGYNITNGGNGGDTLTNHPHRLEIIKKITEIVNKIKYKISEHHADVSGEKNPMFGRKHSEDSKKRMSINTKECYKKNPELIIRLKEIKKIQCNGRNNPNYNPTPVLQYDMDMNFIEEWKDLYSLKENGFNSKLISQCCMGKYKKSHGFIWKFKI